MPDDPKKPFKPQVLYLKDVHTEQKADDAKALLMGLGHLQKDIEDGKVAGVAFAVDYIDGASGSHHFTTGDPRVLYFSIKVLQERMLAETLYYADSDDDDD